MSGSITEKRSQGHKDYRYDPWTGASRERAWEFLEDPSRIPSFFTGAGIGNLDLSQLNSIIGRLTNFGVDPTATEREGIEEFRKATNLQELLKAQEGYFGAITLPGLRSVLAASGGGRSGAETQAVQRAGVEAALPLTALQNERQAELGRLIAGIGGTAAQRGLSGLLGGGQLSLGGAGLQLQQLLARMGIGPEMFGQLLNFLDPLIRKEKTKDWSIEAKGSGGAGYGGGGT